MQTHTANHPAIVIGCGGLGSAALYRLSRRLGPGVLGIEQFRLGHERGASQDRSRIIRLAQHQRQYAALAPAAYEAWHEFEEVSAQQIALQIVQHLDAPPSDDPGWPTHPPSPCAIPRPHRAYRGCPPGRACPGGRADRTPAVADEIPGSHDGSRAP